MRYQVGPLLVDAQQLAVVHDGRPLPLAPKVVEIVVALCEHPGAFVAKDALRERVWPGEAVDDTVLWQKVYLARKALAAALGPGAIETLPRRGYRLTVAVSLVAAAPPIPPQASPRVERRYGWQAAALAVAGLVVVLAVGISRGVATAPGAVLPPAAMEYYNLGRYFLSLRTEDAAHKAEAAFARVTALAPRAANGYAGLADARTVLASERSGRFAAAELRAARAAAETAVRIDPRSGEAQAALGAALARAGVPGDDTRAGAVLARAVALAPGYATGHLWYGEYLLTHGQVAAAVREVQRAIDLEPATPIANVWLAQATYDAGDDVAAARYAARAMGLATSDEPAALRTLGLADERLGHVAAALAAFRKLARWDAPTAEVLTAYIEARHGARAQARRRLARAVRAAGPASVGFWLETSLAAHALGDAATAAASLRRVEALRNEGVSVLALDPRLEAMRRDPRTRSLVLAAFGEVPGTPG